MPNFIKFLNCCMFICLVACKANNHQDGSVQISDAWVRANAPGQAVGAAYMTFTAAQDLTLVYAETPHAGSVEIHSMKMENGVMKMRMLDELTLKTNQTTKLAPGGFHFMLLNLAKPLQAGEQAEFRLCFKDKNGKITDQLVTLPIK